MFTNYDRLAVLEADRIGATMHAAHRGATTCAAVAGAVTCFGNGGFGADERAREEVRRLRELLADAGIEVHGFGVSSEDGYTWALIIASNDFATANRLVWQAWRETWDGDSGFEWVQRGIAANVILESLAQ